MELTVDELKQLLSGCNANDNVRRNKKHDTSELIQQVIRLTLKNEGRATRTSATDNNLQVVNNNLLYGFVIEDLMAEGFIDPLATEKK